MVAHPSAPPYAGGFLILCQRENGASLKIFTKNFFKKSRNKPLFSENNRKFATSENV